MTSAVRYRRHAPEEAFVAATESTGNVPVRHTSRDETWEAKGTGNSMAGVNELVETWRQLIIGDHKSWVLFAHGTCVVLVSPEEDLVGQATGILREYGRVHPGGYGGPPGDFTVISGAGAPGWVITYDHPDVLSYVAPDEVAQPSDVRVGLAGRAKRDRDGRDLTVVHIEDKRA